MRINLLCLVGATLGLVCSVLPWAFVSDHLVGGGVDKVMASEKVSYPQILENAHSDLFYLGLAGVLFIVGSILAFITPLGGLGQVGGVVVFAQSWEDALEHILPVITMPPPPGYTSYRTHGLEIWYFVAIFATVLTLVSAVILVVGVPSERPAVKVARKAKLRDRLVSIRR